MNVSALWPFLTVSWGGLQCVMVVFSDHTPIPFFTLIYKSKRVIGPWVAHLRINVYNGRVKLKQTL